MYRVDVYLRVRRTVMVEGMIIREAARTFGLYRDAVREMPACSLPPGCWRQTPPGRPNPSTSSGGALHRRHRPDLEDEPQAAQEAAPHGQSHLRAAQGRARVRRQVHHRRGLREGAPPPDQGMSVPLSHPPGRAQCGFGEARVIIGGVDRKARCFVLDLREIPGAAFVSALPAAPGGGTSDARGA